MKRLILPALLLGAVAALAGAAPPDKCAPAFQSPIRLKAGNSPIRVEAPGYACPAWVDLKGDGKKQLLVGQFNGGKIKVFPHVGGTEFGPGEWLQVDGKPAEVPGVW